MEKELIKGITETIELLDNKFNNDILIKKFEKSSSDFELLVKNGFAKKRGNNILSVIDKNSLNVSFNL